MKNEIVISTSPGRSEWVKHCLESINVPCLVVSGYGYELGKIKWVYENTNIDKFIFLQDSVVIRNNELLMSLFESEGSACLMCDPSHMGSYLGLYERKILDRIDIPIISKKSESISNEIEWTKRYIEACDHFSHPVDLKHETIFTVMRNGRENMLYVNDLYEKWKGDWGQIPHD